MRNNSILQQLLVYIEKDIITNISSTAISTGSLILLNQQPRLYFPASNQQQQILDQLRRIQYSDQLSFDEEKYSSKNLLNSLQYAYLAEQQRSQDHTPQIYCFINTNFQFDESFLDKYHKIIKTPINVKFFLLSQELQNQIQEIQQLFKNYPQVQVQSLNLQQSLQKQEQQKKEEYFEEYDDDLKAAIAASLQTYQQELILSLQIFSDITNEFMKKVLINQNQQFYQQKRDQLSELNRSLTKVLNMCKFNEQNQDLINTCIQQLEKGNQVLQNYRQMNSFEETAKSICQEKITKINSFVNNYMKKQVQQHYELEEKDQQKQFQIRQVVDQQQLNYNQVLNTLQEINQQQKYFNNELKSQEQLLYQTIDNVDKADINVDQANQKLIKTAKRLLKSNKCYATIITTLTIIIVIKIIIKKLLR